VEDPVEAEYVYNLQQQIYFLELEARYLKEQGMGGTTAKQKEQQEAEKARTFLEDDGSIEEHPVGRPLGDMAQQLRSKCAELQRNFEREVDKATRQQQQFLEKQEFHRVKIELLEKEQAELLQQPDRLMAAIAKEKEEVFAAAQLADATEKEVLSRIDELRSDLEHLGEQRDTLAFKRDIFSKAISELQHELRDARDDYERHSLDAHNVQQNAERLSVRLGDLAEDLVGNAGALSVKEEEALQQRRQQLQGDIRAAQLRLEQAEATRTMLETAQRQLVEVTAENDESIAELERKVAKEKERAVPQADEEAARGQAATLDKLQDTLHEKEQKLAGMRREGAAVKKKTEETARELVRAASELDELNREFEIYKFRSKTLSEDNDRLERETRQLEQQEKQYMAAVAAREDEVTMRINECANMMALTKKLEEQVAMLGGDKVDVKEFETMVQTNVQVAQRFQALMQGFKA